MIQPIEPPQDVEFEDEYTEPAKYRYVVAHEWAGERLDKVVAKQMTEHSRGRIQDWIEGGHVTVNGQVQTKGRCIVSAGDELVVTPQPSQQSLAFAAQAVDFDVVAETDDWLVVNKCAGLVVHPGAGNWSHTLLNGLLYRYPALSGVARAGIVHRLDKDTSGLMVVAKTPEAQTALVRQLQQRTVKRQYVALVHGHITTAPQTIDQPIGRDPRVPVRMAVTPGAGKPAMTHLVNTRPGSLNRRPVSQIRCQLETGRTHQIRVHMAHVGHPLVGDVIYGGQSLGVAQRQMLHAEHLEFFDVRTQEQVSFSTSIPTDMQIVLSDIQWDDS